MKTMKRLTSILLVMAMIVAMSTTAFAASITIKDGAANSEYAAYQLLNATNDGDNYAYTLNEKYDDILATVTGKTEQADIVAYIQALDTDGIRAFADAVYAAITEAAIAADYTTATNAFEDVAQGYYLIAETKVGDPTDTFSLVMLDTAGDEAITVKTKEDKPTVEKKVEEKNDSTGESSWGDSADYDLNDEIDYKITGTVSSKYANYKSYYYSFSDTMVNGLTLQADSIKVTINDVDVTEQFAIVAGDHAFTATANLKELTDVEITADTQVIVTYTVILNENAVSGSEGNPNEVILKYENNPYHEGDGDNNPKTPNEPENPGETPKDVNIAFTYDAIVNKVDNKNEALEGAGFTLYKWVEVTAATDETAAVYDWAPVGAEVKGDAMTTFAFPKLDIGKYKLVETTVPEGYNKADDVVFEIVAEYDLTQDPDTLTALTVKNAEGTVISDNADEAAFITNAAEGKIETKVINNAGAELPSTGGIGTTIFYIVGGILVLGAVVVLVTRKRMGAAE